MSRRNRRAERQYPPAKITQWHAPAPLKPPNRLGLPRTVSTLSRLPYFWGRRRL
ncbi:hypothetical protein B0T18DRAFT_400580 [Schizothecium vesticola]|uniref:Uncharacterized protein n=1 Tax=Schizothecium vesticola TaxID=314040 RepID=A0AA40KDE3_9PEZI|nr:hypothetical protein B0T18DRAFT_400580 [Schizothecium vesticola]